MKTNMKANSTTAVVSMGYTDKEEEKKYKNATK